MSGLSRHLSCQNEKEALDLRDLFRSAGRRVMPCPFCQPNPDRLFHQGERVFGLWDAFPVAPGHALLITKRHVPDWFSAGPVEQRELLDAIQIARDAILDRHSPDGFNIGWNAGEVAGQTIPHLHLHVIPRYRGDTPDPRGGVRNVIPALGNYLAGPRLTTGLQDDHLLTELHRQLDNAHRVDIAVSFVLVSGVGQVENRLVDLLERRGSLRLITGDYLGITDPAALVQLLDLQERYPTQVALHVFEARKQGFHPKAYLFVQQDGRATAFVGSSNLSGPALTGAIEWNYKLAEAHEVEKAFEDLLQRTVPLTAEWVEAYRARRVLPSATGGASLVTDRSDVEQEDLPPPPEPHGVQIEALTALAKTRQEGNRAGLVVLATGLGKTYLAAFDSQPFPRVLFVAHRREILIQAMRAFRSLRPEASFGLYDGVERVPSADLLFASIQTLGRLPHLQQFRRDAFDYIVVDEFHHAHASTYRRLLDHFQPRFMLGLTATPERTDGGDLLALCGQNLVFRCDLVDGVRRDLLAPFHYFGVPDPVDYRNIPWRNGKWEHEALENALIVETRNANALENYRKLGGQKCLAFCCSQRHAAHMAQYFADNGVRAVAVFSGPDSAPRSESLERLGKGELDVVCCVDMFNEGVDLPDIDTVLMLRPTESRIIWLQQLGRGLRRSPGKSHLRIIDYIGNHRTFLVKPQTLFSLSSSDRQLAMCFEILRKGEVPEGLPPGCKVTYDLQALDLMRGLLRLDRGHALRAYYDQFVELHGRRPYAVEAYQDGYNPRSVSPWLGFVRDADSLDAAQRDVLLAHEPFLTELEKTSMTKSYKMLVVQALLNRDALPGSITIEELSDEFAKLATRSARLANDLSVPLEDAAAVRALVLKNPIQAWTDKDNPYFRVTGTRLETTFQADREHRVILQKLAREIVDWRLAEYIDRPGQAQGDIRIECRLSHSGGNPIIRLPSRQGVESLPSGWTPLVVDGQTLYGNFVKIALNVVAREPEGTNILPEVLRGWYGPDAGLPGTRHDVVIGFDNGVWSLQPVGRSLSGAGAVVGSQYKREDIPGLFGYKFTVGGWRQSFVWRGNDIFIMASLPEPGKEGSHSNRFLAGDLFEWPSQASMKQDDPDSQAIARHRERGYAIHLFVRPTRRGSFIYCGDAEFESWEGNLPIHIRLRLPKSIDKLFASPRNG